MGKKSKKQNAEAGARTNRGESGEKQVLGAGSAAGGESAPGEGPDVGKHAQAAVLNILHKAAKKDQDTLNNEGPEQLRERLTKSQKIAREILASLKLEKNYSEQLEEKLKENGIEIPPRPAKQA